jgi:hypothetical protein
MSRVNRLPRPRRVGTAVLAVLGITFTAGVGMQIVHMFEHAVQMGRWVVQPTMMPWMSPWGTRLGEVLANAFAGGRHMAGMELAHMLANLALEIAIIAGLALAWTRGRNTTGLRRAAIFEGFHLAEHVSLAISAVAINTPIGLTTLWGALEAGTPAAIATRILLHFVLNLVATMLTVDAFGDAVGSRRRPREHLVTRPVPTAGAQPV